MRISKNFVLAVILICLVSVNLYSQTDEEIYSGFQFNFLNPSASATGMAGAYTAMSGDIASAFYNPAGLADIIDPYFTIEFSYIDSTTFRAAASDVFMTGSLTGTGEGMLIPSSVGVVYPIGNIVVAVYANTAIRHEERFNIEARAVPGGAMLAPVTGDVYFNGYHVAGSVAIRMSDYMSMGISLGMYYLDIDNSSAIRAINPNDLSDMTTDILSKTITEGDDTSLAFRVGALFQPLDSVTLGVSYSHNPPLSYSQKLYINGDDITGIYYDSKGYKIDSPDRFALGLKLQPLKNLVLTGDVVFVRYNELSDTIMASRDNAVAGIERGDIMSNAFDINEAPEIRVGMELTLGSEHYPLKLRGGFFLNPYHALNYTGTDTSMDYQWNLDAFSDDAGDSEFGFSGGIGLTLSRKLRCDFSYISSDSFQAGMLSMKLIF